MNPTRALTVATLALAACLPSCSLFSSPQPIREIEVTFSDPTTAMPYATSVVVGARGPDGTVHEASGQIETGGTVRALCASLCHSLARAGCEAVYSDLDPEADGEQADARLRRAMRQKVQLPDDWVLVLARSTRAEGATGGSVILTMRGHR